MLICPKCKCEYQEGFTICSDCKVDLIEVPDAVEKHVSYESSGMKRIIIGTVLVISSILAYIGISISAAIDGSHLGGWDSRLGELGTAIAENYILWLPGIIATIMFIWGISILYKELYPKTSSDKK